MALASGSQELPGSPSTTSILKRYRARVSLATQHQPPASSPTPGASSAEGSGHALWALGPPGVHAPLPRPQASWLAQSLTV